MDASLRTNRLLVVRSIADASSQAEVRTVLRMITGSRAKSRVGPE